MRKATGKTGNVAKRASVRASAPYRTADYLRTDADRAAYLEALIEDGDTRDIAIGMRNLAESVGGMGALARKAHLSRETLYRTLSSDGNPRLDTLAVLLAAFGLRLAVKPARKAA